MEMAVLVFGMVMALSLVGLLAVTALGGRFRIWPTPGSNSWQHQVFWLLFRATNFATIVSAVIAVGPWHGTTIGLPTTLRLIAGALMVILLALYVYSLFALGRKNTYCDRDGLVTKGIYRWTRNPQYATIIPLYTAMAVASDSIGTSLLAGATITVYVLMAMVEEPWLAEAYGKPYREYCRRVPRFFGFHRLFVLVRVMWRKLYRLFAVSDTFGTRGLLLKSSIKFPSKSGK